MYIQYCIDIRMRFIWDEQKNQLNLAKHGISFELASFVFDDPLQVTVVDPYGDEERWRTLGVVDGVLMLLVVHTVREEIDENGEYQDEEIRIISARRATRAEGQIYEGAH